MNLFVEISSHFLSGLWDRTAGFLLNTKYQKSHHFLLSVIPGPLPLHSGIRTV